MARRTGIPTLLWVMKRACQLIAKYGALIKSLNPGNDALALAIDAANVACGALADELLLVRDFGT